MRFLYCVLLLSLFENDSHAQALCQSLEYQNRLIALHPELVARQRVLENFTDNHLYDFPRSGLMPGTKDSPEAIIRIPVVVHILYHQALENLSEAQIKSQLRVLNQDFRRFNLDTAFTPMEFRPVAADCGFEFELARIDPHGYATSGIVRKYTAIKAFGIDDAIKHSSQGGDDAWDCDHYLNIWVGNMEDGILGYSSVIGGPKELDGVTVLYSAFGTTGNVAAPFNGGRTATHEIGHWLNLIHTWGDAACGDDHVEDTPWQESADRGCPSEVVKTCGPGFLGNMFMNFMDFTNDACMNLFTKGQRARMRSLFVPEGYRSALISNTEFSALPIPDTITFFPTGEIPQGELFLYPNPCHSQLVVRVPNWSSATLSVDVFNASGQRMLSTLLHQKTELLNVEILPPGVYLVRVGGQAAKMIKW